MTTMKSATWYVMHIGAAAALFGGSIAIAQDPPRVRFFFDTNGVGEQGDRGSGDLSFENPVAPGADRLYLYGQFLSTRYDQWIGMGFDIQVTGGGRITSWHIYNHTTGLGSRWQEGVRMSGQTPTPFVNDATVVSTGIGMFLKDATVFDSRHFRSHQEDQVTAFGNTLLGYIDVDSNGSPYSEVRLGVGSFGFDARNVFPIGVAFGFGDEGAGIESNSYGVQSPIADATIIPEPTTLLSALAAGAVWVSRRR
ncbi:MAG: hypothetical protein CHACPFDD_01543 [Phycisphaerae bacterium]|nr:hypothetical protein [Phycisphaerae bacterium]